MYICAYTYTYVHIYIYVRIYIYIYIHDHVSSPHAGFPSSKTQFRPSQHRVRPNNIKVNTCFPTASQVRKLHINSSHLKSGLMHVKLAPNQAKPAKVISSYVVPSHHTPTQVSPKSG